MTTVGFPRPVVVDGLPGSEATYAEKCLRRLGLQVESPPLTPAGVRDLLKRQALIIWLETPEGLRSQRLRRTGMPLQDIRDLLADEPRERRRAMRAVGVEDCQAEHFAWWKAQIVVYDNAGRRSLGVLLRQLAAELTYPEHLRFMDYDHDLVLRPGGELGGVLWQLYVMGTELAVPAV